MNKENPEIMESISEIIKGFEWVKNQINEAWLLFLIYQHKLMELISKFEQSQKKESPNVKKSNSPYT